MSYENESKKGFLIYASVLEAMKHLSDSEYRECVEKMANYAMNDVVERGSSPMVDIILTLAFPNLDASRKHHDWAIENGKKGAPYGKNGGRPRKGESKEDYDRRKAIERSGQEEPKTPKKPLNINIDNNIDIDINKKEDIDIEKNIDKDIDNNNEDLFSKKNVISSFDLNSKYVSKEKFEDEMNESELKSENALITDNTSFILKEKDKGCCEARCTDEREGGITPAPPTKQKERTTIMSIEDAILKALFDDIEKLIDMDNGKINKDPEVIKRAVKNYRALDASVDYNGAISAIQNMKTELRKELVKQRFVSNSAQ